MSRMVRGTALVMGIALLAISETASAKAVTLGRTETNTDYVSSGVCGLGNTGTGTINVAGVTGPIRKVFLYWHGIDNSGEGAQYDNETVTFAGNEVTGISLGDASTNCWSSGGSRSFFADVTNRVSGNGDYSITGLNGKSGHSGNGASLIVLFDDGDANNNRDLVFFEGNDSDIYDPEYPDDPAGWAAVLNGITYTGGSVYAQVHAGDGQGALDDTSVTFTGSSPVTISDSSTLWDGVSVPTMGQGRQGNGLWDIHTFDISGAFDAPGDYSINFTNAPHIGDCHSLVVMMLDLAEGSAPCGNGVFDEGEECDPAGTGDADCTEVESCLNDCTCGCANDAQCNDGVACTIDTCNTETGACTNDNSECDFCEGMCGDPLAQFGRISAIDAQFILRASVELEECALCVCDVDSSGEILSSDALRALRYAVGLAEVLDCPAGVASTTTTTLPEVTTTTIPETTTTTLATFCGDGAVNDGEECDDANTGSGDGCTSECVDEFCGDGIDNDGEAEGCDDANTSNSDSCVDGCVAASCGDGFVQEGVEECDGGDITSFPRGVFIPCLPDCTLPEVTTTTLAPFCGDGVVNDGEECDDANTGSGDGCTGKCLDEFCGDGDLNDNGAEECDDGNTGSGDGCTSECLDEFCGDGITNDGKAEQCDDANSSNEDSCVAGCVAASCGDGFVQGGVEQCDDANTSNSDSCVDGCVPASCGDGFVQEGVEECDDGNSAPTLRGSIIIIDECLPNCTLPMVTTTTLQPL
jgi:cysteine-rich repeat protein